MVPRMFSYNRLYSVSHPQVMLKKGIHESRRDSQAPAKCDGAHMLEGVFLEQRVRQLSLDHPSPPQRGYALFRLGLITSSLGSVGSSKHLKYNHLRHIAISQESPLSSLSSGRVSYTVSVAIQIKPSPSAACHPWLPYPLSGPPFWELFQINALPFAKASLTIRRDLTSGGSNSFRSCIGGAFSLRSRVIAT